MKDTTVKARVETDLKHDVEIILHQRGMTMSDAINAMLIQIKLHKDFPFEPKIPNKLTAKTLKDSAKGKNTKRFNSTEALFKDLGI
jgi:DNA-damage-inducible protein J